jgi:DMSO/TMAO reductase YedYZ molybdopterin-dependent catalytic subunit/thiosulfate reductase cytochrome b subunit
MSLDTFPAWLRVAHWVNVLFLSFLLRSGLEILSTHPHLYWRDHARPDTAWARFTQRRMPKEKMYTALDEEEEWPSTVAMPGYANLGLGRKWHFASVLGWVALGVVYFVLLFATGQWQRYIPTSPGVFPAAWGDIVTYLSLHIPATLPGQPFNALQKLTYAAVIFLLGPFQIATGAAQSPAIEGRFPWYVKLFGGRQSARSLHFLGLVAFCVFAVVHVFLVIVEGKMATIIQGSVAASLTNAYIIAGVSIAALIVAHIVATKVSLRHKRATQRVLGAVVNTARRALLHRLASRQHYPAGAITPVHRVNGYPPASEAYKIAAAHHFTDWRLQLGGLVEHPLSLSLADLHAMHRQRQGILHNCIQGWTGIAEWVGIPLARLLELAGPVSGAKYVLTHSAQLVERDEPHAKGTGHFYEVMDLSLASHDQTILAYEMNGQPLPVEHGAPLRLRVETSVGFKMVKWVDRIDLIDDYTGLGAGMGGWREDNMYYDKEGEI